MQIAFLPLLFLAGVYAIIRKRVRPDPLSFAEIVLYIAALLSAAVTMFRGLYELTEYSIVFFASLMLFSIAVRSIPLEGLLDTAAMAALFETVTCLLVERRSLLVALSVHHDEGGLTRFTPLGTNPDVVGLIFGSSVILMARRVLLTKHLGERVAMIMGMLLALVFVVAASARASFLALCGACIVAFAFELRLNRSTYWKMAAACVLLVPLIVGRLYAYLSGIFELNSRYRGVESGGSGRTIVWAKGVAAIFADPIRLSFGGGFRSSEKSYIGFFTEDAYISVLLDSGLFIGTAIIGIYLFAALKALRKSRQSGRSKCLILVFTYFVFVLCESVFNRYLLAIGNPCSLITLMMLMSLSIGRQPVGGVTREFASNGRAAG